MTYLLFHSRVTRQSLKRPLILISGFIHDVSMFMDEHPSGLHLLVKFIGKDTTTAFFGDMYDHSNAAHNSLAMKRVGVLHGGHPHVLNIVKRIPQSTVENCTVQRIELQLC
ncbi:uncharacterized protein BT62DRAFT_537092 [Guyanagaster necrorhizus]|uniref:Cytochrome b5 heme-binding domain-containing protein n=1 Tax=Guyanagaster necrorhizus TaxID=856835 RepID=A0A9P7W2H7_9AGAR|nr:uncharacterized protein BT62DRAFT_537092 [Guyanagaster necrorhizus MCA 3950]KAG7450809.1 hypothetical protein BT62DRAFT_537092 [Guyanagaster necrorhizus MCA 3950]